jgi:branched-subunit amino acid aminotransferase/4-amino-4-deoxychorismate lyase
MLEMTTATTVDLAHSAARHGAGLFETIRAENGHPLLLDLHMHRLAKGAAFLGMKPPPTTGQMLDFLLCETELALHPVCAIRLLAVDRSILVCVNTWTPPPEDAVIMLSHVVTRFSASPLNHFKTLSYLENLLLHREAEAHRVFESIALNETGHLTDGGRTNVFLVKGDRIITPPERDGCLPGVVRRALLDARMAEEVSVGVREIKEAEGIFLTSALREIMPVQDVVGVGPKDPHHPLIRSVQDAYREIRKR